MKPNTGALVAIALVIVLIVVLVPALWMGSMMGGYGAPWGMMGAGAWWMLLFPVSLVLGVVLLVVWAVRQSGSQGSASSGDGALAILQQRYARGEIGREEYERIRDELAQERGAR